MFEQHSTRHDPRCTRAERFGRPLVRRVSGSPVNDIKDPDGQGRVKVTFPGSPDTDGARYEPWARLATFMGGNNRGSWFIPDVNDEVLLVFEGGDPRRPYVVGALWNGNDSPT